MTYWEERAKEIIKEETLSDKEISEEIERIINEMIDDIEKEIAKFYARYATSEGISMSEAKKKVDAFDVVKFANQAKQYVDTRDFSDVANKELRAYNTKMYVSREKLLKAQIGLLVTYTYAKLESQMHNYMESAYYRALKQQAGILGDTLQVASTDVKAIVLAPFQNSNWSRRLWRDMKRTRIQVQRAVTHVIVRGRHPYEFVKELRKESGNSTYEIRRLLITETARVQTIATKQHMLENQGPDAEYKYVAKLDGKTTKTCRGLNGKVFKVKDMKPGVNAPPMHPFCRSSVVPYVGDWREEFFEKRKGKYAFGGIVE
ncbi:minor capsid protein [Staphylococcus epidermidis]|nr:minor capsid protein [Staphylococcus epidermidis]MDH8773786.1 minor capsid protein [Staphylococcus epidermidis]MDH8818055.1 minor capsid protein [Staphylococcus epidermidis]MDH8845040.1 minor capsid protein [Staphylococcus epidermidis]MDH8862759.1 minor capsid protein [Staphylococcus epidermidis]